MEGISESILYGQTQLHPVGLLAVIALGLASLILPQRFALWPLVAMICFISPAQRVVVMGLDLTLLRLLLAFMLVRVLSTGELLRMRLNGLDVLVAGWAVSRTFVYTAQVGDFGAFVTQAGQAFEVIGAYFVARALIHTWKDIESVVLAFAVLSIPVAGAFLFERVTRQNLFAMFGGVPAVTYVRDGALRCQGPFPHAIMAGCFWAALVPLFVGVLPRPEKRTLAVVATVCALFVVWCSGSSTPVMAVIFGAVGAAFYPVRDHMQLVRRVGLVTLVALHFVMIGPVWSLLAKVNVVSGSTGWHRYHLVDEAINHFGEWWLFGTSSTAHWGAGLSDVTNQYVLEGVRGGLWTLVLFVAIVIFGFRYVGQTVRAQRNAGRRFMAWFIGVSVFVHVTAFLGVSYFGQILVLWYLTLAIAATRPSAVIEERREVVR